MAASLIANGQTELITGKVFAFKDTPVANVKITAKKSKKSVTTDEMGNFSIECKDKDKLVFEADGFRKEVKKVVEGQRLNVKMLFMDNPRNSEIAIGSGHLTEESLMYSKSNFLEYNNDYQNYADIFALIQGKFPGVKVVTEDGGGGVKQRRIVIRNVQYVSNTGFKDNTALYLVDGQIWQDISVLAPEEIKSINVMKDGAPLGFRGANGAVIITTFAQAGNKGGN